MRRVCSHPGRLASVTNEGLSCDPLTNEVTAACVGISWCQPCQVSSGGNEASIVGRETGRPGPGAGGERGREELLISHDGPEIITLILLPIFDKVLQLYYGMINVIQLQSFA